MQKPPRRPRPSSAAGRLVSRHRDHAENVEKHPEFRDFKLMPMECEFQRCQVDGCVKRPKLRSDEAKLKELFMYCREANFREVRALVFHYPYLLAMTDGNGFTALHHAEMSSNAEFVRRLLELYHDPRTWVKKFVRYECEHDLRTDGLRLHTSRGSRSEMHSATGMPHEPSKLSSVAAGDPVIVRLVAPNSIAAAAGVVPGDTMEAVEGALVNGVHAVMLSPDDVCAVVNEGARLEDGYPLTLEFHGPASAEILGRNGWTPLHAAEGGGVHYDKVSQVLRQEQQKLPTAPHDGHGCTPEHWGIISKRSCSGPRRRPLSAGPCAQRRPDLAAQRRIMEREGGSAGWQMAPSTSLQSVNARLMQRLVPKPAPSPPPPPPPLSP